MPKLPVLKPKELITILHKVGFEIDHITGSHYIMYRSTDGKRVSVPYHTKDLPPGTLHSILKSADLKREDL